MPNIVRSKDDVPEVQPETKLRMERGYTADMIDRRKKSAQKDCNNNTGNNNNNNNNSTGYRGNVDSSTPRALRRSKSFNLTRPPFHKLFVEEKTAIDETPP